MSEIKVLVSVDDDHLSKFPQVVDDAKSAGMTIDEQMDAIGVISGSIDSSQEALLKNVEGIAHVETSQDYQIAPPKSPVQ